jgi:hypothetical protein
MRRYHRGRQVEEAAGTLHCQLNGSRVEEVHLKQSESCVRTVQGQQVLLLLLVLYKNDWSRCLLRLNPAMNEFVRWAHMRKKRGLQRFLTVALTVYPLSRRLRTSHEPMKPPPPVT